MRLLLVPCLLLAACGSRARPDSPREAVVPGESLEPTVEIPAGRLVVGSVPNVAGRDRSLEADRVPVELDEFTIDRTLRARNGVPIANVSRDDAARICAEQDLRLCGELEWEQACSGGGRNAFPTGGSLDVARCRTEPCRSSFGVDSLGTRLGEWTSSVVEVNGHPLALVRGSDDDSAGSHRCAARRLVDPSSASASIGFRCCEGDPSATAYPREEQHGVFETVEVRDEQLATALATVPELAGVASGFRRFTDGERNAVIARAAARTPPFVVATDRVVRAVLRWTPMRGETVWVVSGHSGSTAVIAVLHPLGDGGFAHAASLVMPAEPSAVVVTMRDPATKTLGFSTCFDCGGEDGEIRLRDDGRFVVVTR